MSETHPHKIHLSNPVHQFMTKAVVTARADASLEDIERTLERHAISCVPIVGAGGRAIGTISRTDLLKTGRRDGSGHGGPLAPLGTRHATDVLPPQGVATVRPDDTVSAAAHRMVKDRIHRVFVEESDCLVGVLSTKDLLVAIKAARVDRPLGEVMSKPAFTIPVTATLAHATDRLGAAHVTGLAVIDEDGWPVGLFGQLEALAARDLPGETPIDEVMNHALACLHVRAPLHRAAALAHDTRARRVLVVEHRDVVGVVTPLDFARVISG